MLDFRGNAKPNRDFLISSFMIRKERPVVKPYIKPAVRIHDKRKRPKEKRGNRKNQTGCRLYNKRNICYSEYGLQQEICFAEFALFTDIGPISDSDKTGRTSCPFETRKTQKRVMNMKRFGTILLIVTVCLGLAGCSIPTPPPQTAADGTPWSAEWETIGGVLGVETPEAFTLLQNNDTLASNGMTYATWSMGEGEPYTTQDDKEATLYDAQLYILLARSESPEKAQETLAEWMGLGEEMYVLESSMQESYGGQEFTVLTYSYASAENPYSAGASALGVFANYTVSVEITCRGEAANDPKAILTDFLEHCHYAGE